MRLALNMAKMVQCGFSRAPREEMQQLIKTSWAKVREEKKCEVEFPGYQQIKAAMERHPAMVYKNHMAGCLPCENGIVKNILTCSQRKETAAPPPEPVAPPPGTPPAPPGHSEATDSYVIDGMPSRCVYMHSPLANPQFFNHNAFAKDRKDNKDCVPDLLSTLSAAWKYC
jgi:hypothetical protein